MTCGGASRAASKSDVTFDSEADRPRRSWLVAALHASRSSWRAERDRSRPSPSPSRRAPNVRVVAADEPDTGRVGWAGRLHCCRRGRRAARGKTSRIVLEARGAELAHVWSTGGRATPSASMRRCDIRRRRAARRRSRCASCQLEGETTDDRQRRGPALRGQRTAPERARARAQAVVERHVRPPGARSRTRASRCRRSCRRREGSRFERGARRRALTADALSAFDAVVIGAPEELNVHPRSRRCGCSHDGGAGQWCSFPTGGRRAAISS